MTKRAIASVTILFALAPTSGSAQLQPPERQGPKIVAAACNQPGFLSTISCYVLQLFLGPPEEPAQDEQPKPQPPQ